MELQLKLSLVLTVLLFDLKAKVLGISVPELFGGPTRDKVRVYWSHCGSSRIRHQNILGTPPIAVSYTHLTLQKIILL